MTIETLRTVTAQLGVYLIAGLIFAMVVDVLDTMNSESDETKTVDGKVMLLLVLLWPVGLGSLLHILLFRKKE